MNSISQVETVAVDGPNGPTSAIMLAVNVTDADAVESFMAEVVEQFKVTRMLAPPDTSMLLVTIIGDLSAEEFAAMWSESVKHDEIIRTFMSRMTIAESVQGTRSGQQLSKASLLAQRPLPPPGRQKPWWKPW